MNFFELYSVTEFFILNLFDYQNLDLWKCNRIILKKFHSYMKLVDTSIAYKTCVNWCERYI